MTWQDRIHPEIFLVSPLKKLFFGLWRENPQEMEKSLGVHKYPGIAGAFIQDQDVGAVSYPIDFFFEGDDHDREAAAFFQACRENGPWEILHPVDGNKTSMYLVKVSRNMAETSVSEFTTTWLESSADEEIISRPATPEFVSFQSTLIFDQAADEFDRKVTQETETQKQAVRFAGRKLIEKIRAALAFLYELNNEINSRVNAIQSAINKALNEFILRPLALAAQIQQLIQLPALALNNIRERLEAFRELAESIFGLTPETTFPRDRNTVAVMELALGAVLASASLSLVTGPLVSRQEAIENAEFLTELFAFVTDGLDELEELFSDLQADRQFFSQSETFALLSNLITLAANAAVKQSFDLAIEKRFTLDRARAPIEITITEYGDLGENDSNLELFNNSNALQGNDLILLPAGREVVVYI